METMRGVNIFIFSCFALSSLSFFPLLNASSELDLLYWNERAREANKSSLSAYEPDPNSVSSSFRSSVAQFLSDPREMNIGNHTRRSLAKKKGKGPCDAANPIDRCWRCDPNWANNRKKLANCVQGFGRKTTGGKDGRYYVVTDPSDDDLINPRPGTLRHAVIQREPLWIIFARSMIIRLQQELIMFRDKTIDGRGFNVHIAYGAGITIQFTSNVIIHGLHIHDIVPKKGGKIRDSVYHVGHRTRSDGDGISIYGGSNIWIDHNSMYNCSDGLIDAIVHSTAITISNNHFTKHNDVMLFGAADSYSLDKVMQITLAFNHFGKGLIQRMPRVRYGFVHILNNDYTFWKMYAVGGNRNPTIISEGNRYRAAKNPDTKSVTKRDFVKNEDSSNWQWKSIDDEFLNGAHFEQSGPDYAENPKTRLQMIPRSKGVAISRLTRDAGTLGCKVGKPC